MNATINSRVAIQARIAEWRRYRNDFAPAILVSELNDKPLRWFKAA